MKTKPTLQDVHFSLLAHCRRVRRPEYPISLVREVTKAIKHDQPHELSDIVFENMGAGILMQMHVGKRTQPSLVENLITLTEQNYGLKKALSIVLGISKCRIGRQMAGSLEITEVEAKRYWDAIPEAMGLKTKLRREASLKGSRI